MADMRLSNRTLLLVFLLALGCFSTFRLLPGFDVEQQLQTWVEQQNTGLHYQSLQLDGLSVVLNHVDIPPAWVGEPLTIERLKISPHWFALLWGERAAGVQALVKNAELHAELELAERMLVIHQFDARIEGALLSSLFTLPIPVDIHGTMMLAGNIEVDASSMQPLRGSVELSSDDITLTMTTGDMIALGSLQGSSHGEAGVWQGNVASDGQLAVQAKAEVRSNGAQPAAWPVSGEVLLQATPPTKGILTMIPNQGQRVRVSGTLAQPQLQIMP